jgi:hypothetical protein
MKITVFTSNQPRHRALIASLSKISDSCHAIIECKTAHPGKVPGFYNESDVMQRYFNKVQTAENRMFGDVGFLEGAKVLPLQRGDLSLLSPQQLGAAMDADIFVIFGSSVISGWLLDILIARRAVNIHMGVSPYYRGSSTNFWALADDNPHLVGATIHLLSAGVDMGDILFHVGAKLDGCSDAFDFGMAAVRDVQKTLVGCIKSGVLDTQKALAQDLSCEIRYSRNVDFTDKVAENFLSKTPSLDYIQSRLQASKEKCTLVQAPVYL